MNDFLIDADLYECELKQVSTVYNNFVSLLLTNDLQHKMMLS